MLVKLLRLALLPENGADKRGTTAPLNSMNKINYKNFANGINFNIVGTLPAMSDDGKSALGSLYKVFFKRGGTCRFRLICWILRF